MVNCICRLCGKHSQKLLHQASISSLAGKGKLLTRTHVMLKVDNHTVNCTTGNKTQIKLIGRSEVKYFSTEVNLQGKTSKVKMYDLLLNSLWPTEKCTDEKKKT